MVTLLLSLHHTIGQQDVYCGDDPVTAQQQLHLEHLESCAHSYLLGNHIEASLLRDGFSSTVFQTPKCNSSVLSITPQASYVLHSDEVRP